eukprot:1862283-Alexandrium_andersonii.AAC.1
MWQGFTWKRTRARTSGSLRQSGSSVTPHGPSLCALSRLAPTAWSEVYLARSWRPSTSLAEC